MHSVERIGRYRLERLLGTGAFGTVWLAHDDVLEARVAVKVLADNWTRRLDVRERFLSEARMLRRAASNRVVQVYDIGELPDGRPYFVMEYADGGTLADLLAAGPLPVSEALRLTALAARGAAALHEAGIVHRDIKPTNVLLRAAPGNAPRVLLADLGLAKSLAEASGLTLGAGSAGYRPPEQAEPGVGVDERADVYGLGAVGYHLVTGTVPGPPGKVERPDRLRAGLDPGVQRALLRALDPDRERRWPTAQMFAEELERLAAATPARRGPFRRRTAALVLLGAVVAAVTTVLVNRHSAPDEVRVADSTGRVSVEVPAAWGRELRDSGWDPRSVGLPAGHEPGLVVANDLGAWQDLAADADGVFAGVSDGEAGSLAHPGCRSEGSRAYRGEHWRGTLRVWDCGSGGTVTDAGLAPADGAARPQVYVQIRQHDGASRTDRVLDSVRVEK